MYACGDCGREYEDDDIENSEGQQVQFICEFCPSGDANYSTIEKADDEDDTDA